MKCSVYNEVFVFVAGGTPQIITECIFALSQQSPPIYASQIHIITTSLGQRVIRDALVTRGILQQLIDEYQLPHISTVEITFHVIKGADGAELDDIRSIAANEATGDLIVELLRELTSDPGTRLHCSLAGGRKTMSFYLGAALELFGRKWDRLYHVLITPDFETHPEFFYKPKCSRSIESVTRSGERLLLDTDDAEIELAELPFIRLRDKLSCGGQGFKSLVRKGQSDIDTATVIPEIVVKFAERSVLIGRYEVEFLPMQLAIYSAVLKQKVLHCKYRERDYCGDCTGCYLPFAELTSRPALEDIAKDYSCIYASSDKGTELLEKWATGLDPEVLRQNVSKLNRTIRETIADESVAAFYLVKPSRRTWGNSSYGVRVDKGKILYANRTRAIGVGR